MAYVYDPAELGVLLGLLPTLSFPALIGIASYVLSALALYTAAKRRGIHKPWLAWIPVVNCWILGSLSDQYRYVVLGQNRSKRKSLLVLSILTGVLGFFMTVQVFGAVFHLITAVFSNVSEARMLELLTGPVLRILGLSVPAVGVSIAYAIIYYMALYDVYKSMDPNNCVVFLVLSILFHVTEPFFLFFNRNKDQGMPPRRDEPVYTAQEPWENQ